jgi:hypothetical protein
VDLNLNATVDLVVDHGADSIRLRSLYLCEGDLRRAERIRTDVNVNAHGGVHVQVHVNVDVAS